MGGNAQSPNDIPSWLQDILRNFFQPEAAGAAGFTYVGVGR